MSAAPSALSSPAPPSAVAASQPHRRDPRPYQIAVLGSLLLYGTLALDLEVGITTVAVLLGTALLSQWLCTRLWRLPRFDPRSALISGLSLCLLLRTGSLWVAALAAVVTIGSKFLLRTGNRHIWNPTNFGLVLLLLLPVEAWVSPGQWGSLAYFAALLIGLGGLVVMRAERSDVTWAFLVSWGGLIFGRALWLGDPIAIPIHQLSHGGLLIFAFLMISDPKTTPSSRAGRIIFAASVAALAGWIQFGLYRPHGLLWSLALCAPLVPMLDRWLPGLAYAWPGASPSSVASPFNHPRPNAEVFAMPMSSHPKSPAPSPSTARVTLLSIVVCLLLFFAAGTASAFCGFYVAKADTSLFNKASKVVLARDGDRTVITMVNDFQGNVDEFAMVVPVPTFLEREQIHVGDRAAIEHLDAYTSPRLVEYFDADPCALQRVFKSSAPTAAMAAQEADGEASRSRSLGVTVEARYSVGEYDIAILSAKESDGLEVWLRENGYRTPRGASRVLASYIRQKMRFFVAKVDVTEQKKLGFSYLRPLQVAYESPKFMLPIRLGTLNAEGPQELFVFALSPEGRIETTNYRTVKLPSDMEIPPFVKDDFSSFYRDMFARQVEKENQKVVFLEYAWDMAWCDPCAADPLSRQELRQLGVFWQTDDQGRAAVSPAQNVFVTRLHVRYTAETFPEDLVFQQTSDRSNFQGRYVLRHPWTGNASCAEAADYRRRLVKRQDLEAQALASLTGWDIGEIRQRIPGIDTPPPKEETSWWKKLWGSGGR